MAFHTLVKHETIHIFVFCKHTVSTGCSLLSNYSKWGLSKRIEKHHNSVIKTVLKILGTAIKTVSKIKMYLLFLSIRLCVIWFKKKNERTKWIMSMRILWSFLKRASRVSIYYNCNYSFSFSVSKTKAVVLVWNCFWVDKWRNYQFWVHLCTWSWNHPNEEVM